MMIDYFKIQELVSRSMYNRRGDKAWQLFDDKALVTLEYLRENLGQCTVNDWSWGGSFEQSGLRDWEFFLQLSSINNDQQAKEAYANSLSQHKFGRAFDCKFKNYTAEEARQWIKDNWHKSGYNWAITLEEDVSWLHFDVRNRTQNQVYSFKP